MAPRIAATKTIHIGFIPGQMPIAIPNPDDPPTGMRSEDSNRPQLLAVMITQGR
jgi:hypothetical protein